MAKVTDEYVRRAFLARFARMRRESQDAVIEAMETVRDATNPEDEPAVMVCCGKTTADGHSRNCKEYPPERLAFFNGDKAPERTPGAATIPGGLE